MPKHVVVFILGTVVTASASLAATSSRNSTSQKSAVHAPTVPEVFQSTPRKDPYGRLFTAKPDRQMPTAARESSAQQRPAPDAGGAGSTAQVGEWICERIARGG